MNLKKPTQLQVLKALPPPQKKTTKNHTHTHTHEKKPQTHKHLLLLKLLVSNISYLTIFHFKYLQISVTSFGRLGDLNIIGSNPDQVKPMTLKLIFVAS